MSFADWMEESAFWGLLIVMFAIALGLAEHIAEGAPEFAAFSVTTAGLASGHATWLRIQTWERRP
ncbi:hypothetical protein A9R16_003465 [Acidiferrobacter thiooxydans]|uniref:hypothetical protein n=1 Tax=Acidiferrobacter thiooxydans TaxID=163359 RepID=UPI000826954A|nr:hypothetical protein [Acidiferrobacter thiooxydans]UEO00473.1 hypothetical protein A9R16_003465 [Acidiferrobacter thiooxydans]